jgi:iron complex transport system substrate-binding protein
MGIKVPRLAATKPGRADQNRQIKAGLVIIARSAGKRKRFYMKKIVALFLSVILCVSLFAGCTTTQVHTGTTRVITDSAGRQVEVPEKVESIVCVGVGALRYTCYMGAQDLVIGVEDCEVKPVISRLYNFVNIKKFQDLPITGANGNPYPEEIIQLAPDVIVMSKSASAEADTLQNQTGTPVIVVPGSDATLDKNAYETIRIMGQLYGKEERAAELTAYLQNIEKDLNGRTKDVPETDKPSVYVGGVSFKGHHGFEGTEAGYGPFALIGAKNLADTTGQTGAFNIDLEKVLSWDPDVIFLDFNGMKLINEDYAKNPDYYNALTAVREGNVYSQISFRSNASNLETALADAYYAACILYPQQFADIDPVAKAQEIFEKLLGVNPYADLKEAGYEFRPIKIGE